MSNPLPHENATVVSKGPWTHRFLVRLFTVVLVVLNYWLLDFVMRDIGTWPGPTLEEVEKRLLDPQLPQRADDLAKQIEETQRTIADQQIRQTLLRDSTANSQQTMNQLLEFQKLNLQKEITPTAEEQKALADSQQLFLQNQQKYQELNEELARLNETLRGLNNQQRVALKELEEARKPVYKELESLQRRHNWKVAAVKLAVLVPLLFVAVVLFVRKRASIYAPLVYAFGIAVLLKVFFVMHEYFPARYFKYVLILAALAIVMWVLVHLVRMMAFPKRGWLLKQYRDAYEAFFCPVCDYPIRRGPLKYLFWNRRSIKKLHIPPGAAGVADEPYTCPMCGTKLFEECPQCHGIRHSLLPACVSCGAVEPVVEKAIQG
jgi:hypothetical protein